MICRRVYICLLIFVVACGAAMNAMGERVLAARHPTVTSRLAGGRQLRRMDFPAVALCPSNLISRAALRIYARYLSVPPAADTHAHTYIHTKIRPRYDLCRCDVLLNRTLNIHFHRSELDGNRTYTRGQLERHLAVLGAVTEMVHAPADLDVRFAGFLAALGQNNVSDIAYRVTPRLLTICTTYLQA